MGYERPGIGTLPARREPSAYDDWARSARRAAAYDAARDRRLDERPRSADPRIARAVSAATPRPSASRRRDRGRAAVRGVPIRRRRAAGPDVRVRRLRLLVAQPEQSVRGDR